MNITATLKILPFLSIFAASLLLVPELSMAGDNSRQHNRSSAQHSKKMFKQPQHRNNSRKAISHQRQAKPHYNRASNRHGGIKRHYKARPHYRYNENYTYQPQYINNGHPYTVTRVYQPLPVVHTPVVTPGITLGLHTGNVTLSLNGHQGMH